MCKVAKNIGSMRSKGVHKKIIHPSALRFMKPNLQYVGATVIEFCFFNQIKKKLKITNIAHMYIKLLIADRGYGDLHLHVRN